jgi:hypothetical protein
MEVAHMSFLEELYLGNLFPPEWNDRKGEGYFRTLEQVIQEETKMLDLLDDAGKEQFREYQSQQMELSSVSERKAFEEGVCFGARIMMEVLNPESDKL